MLVGVNQLIQEVYSFTPAFLASQSLPYWVPSGVQTGSYTSAQGSSIQLKVINKPAIKRSFLKVCI